jgi:NAD+ diphosphatase
MTAMGQDAFSLGAGLGFGGGGIERAAALRGDPAALALALAEPLARVLPMLDGQPLLAGPDQDRLGLLAPDHPLVGGAASIWLGRQGGRAVFACEVAPAAAAAAALPPDHAFGDLRRAVSRLGAADAELAAMARALALWHASHLFCARCGSPSAMAQAGWQRLCPACGAHHFPRTDPVVIMLVTAGERVLLGRSHGWPGQMHSLLAGYVEPGETIEAAVRREVAEETAIPVGEVVYLASQPWPFPASLMIGCAGRAQGTQIVLDPVELESARWMGRAEAVGMLAGRHAEVAPPRPGSIARMLLEGWVAGRIG